MNTLQHPTTRLRPVIRVFVSSTFSDLATVQKCIRVRVNQFKTEGGWFARVTRQEFDLAALARNEQFLAIAA